MKPHGDRNPNATSKTIMAQCVLQDPIITTMKCHKILMNYKMYVMKCQAYQSWSSSILISSGNWWTSWCWKLISNCLHTFSLQQNKGWRKQGFFSTWVLQASLLQNNIQLLGHHTKSYLVLSGDHVQLVAAPLGSPTVRRALSGCTEWTGRRPRWAGCGWLYSASCQSISLAT